MVDKPHWTDGAGWRSIRACAELVGIVVGLIGILLLWLELRQIDRAATTAHSLKLVERFHSGDLAAARANLDNIAFGYNVRFRTSPDSQRPNQDQIRLIAIGEMLSDSAASRAKLEKLVLVSRFLDEAALCVEADLCRRDIVCQYFSTYARGLNATFEGAISEYRRTNNLKNFGVGIDSLRHYKCEPLFSQQDSFWHGLLRQ